MCVRLLANALIDPFVVGTIARFEVTAPSGAFSVDTVGRVCPCGQSVRNPNGPGGTAVTFTTCAWALAGIPHVLELTCTSSEPTAADPDRKSTRLNSSHLGISYAVFC